MNKDLALCVAAATLSYMLDKKNRKKKRLWSRQWLLRRREESVAFRLLRELREEDPDTLRQWTRLDQQQFQDLLALVTPLIKKQDTNMRQAVSPAERLTLTLRYLATGLHRHYHGKKVGKGAKLLPRDSFLLYNEGGKYMPYRKKNFIKTPKKFPPYYIFLRVSVHRIRQGWEASRVTPLSRVRRL
ncbi:hypothetical protein GWK47_042138 [Chionoecetes opilio]|uniref:Uncharacterized protein n=1 Tax=Chionoecetes opilio TaxID=41210 RepID=A0A8J4YIG1_CHIOP|nr:hypothetical protein GWK47_042138 [Chionoecetes opilio]